MFDLEMMMINDLKQVVHQVEMHVIEIRNIDYNQMNLKDRIHLMILFLLNYTN
jgi:hypothetical protein